MVQLLMIAIMTVMAEIILGLQELLPIKGLDYLGPIGRSCIKKKKFR